jgi:cell division septal protein FtsQ
MRIFVMSQETNRERFLSHEAQRSRRARMGVKVAGGVLAGVLVGALAGSVIMAWLRPPRGTSRFVGPSEFRDIPV